MSSPPTSPEERFATMIEEFRGLAGITPPSREKRFGASALKIHNRVFAMLVGGRLALKLPKSRVDALIAAGDGERYDPRHDGRLLKEWVTIESTRAEQWLPLAREAMEFVGANH